MLVMWSFNSAKLIRLSLIILIVAKTSGNAFVNNKVAQILLKASWNTACRGGGWTVNIILLDPATSMRSVLAGQECRTGPRATDGWMGGALPWLPSCDVTMSSPIVMLPEPAVTETEGGSELCHTGHYKTSCKVYE